MQESKAKSSQFGDMELTHTAFIQKLLKECKTKVCALSSTFFRIYLASPVFSDWDGAATTWPNSRGPIKARPQHRQLRALLFTNSVWVF